MTPNRTLLAALGLATAAALTLTGCSAKSSTTTASGPTTAPATQSTPTPTRPASAADRLTAAIHGLNGIGYDFTETEGLSTRPEYLSGSGSYDPTANAATVELKGHFDGYAAEFAATQIGSGVQTDQKLWSKINVGPLNTNYDIPRTKWMSLDPGKITGVGAIPFDLSNKSDVLDIADLMTSVSGVQSTSATAITGKVDVTRSEGVNGINPDEYSSDGAKATAVPFVVTLDGQGHLISLVLDSRGFDKDLYRKFTFTNFGSPHAIKPPPASSVVAATAKNYEYFNS